MSIKDAQVQNGMLDRKKLGNAIRAKREQEKLSLDALAKVVGISKPTLSRLERALFWPNTQNLLAICRWLNQPPESFSFGAPKKSADREPSARTTRRHYITPVNAGLPGSVEGQSEELDLVAELMPDADEYFSVKAKGNSMVEASINDGDRLIARVSGTAQSGDIVIADINNASCVKQYLVLEDGTRVLRSANPEYADILVSKKDKFEIRGIVIHSIHQHKRSNRRRL